MGYANYKNYENINLFDLFNYYWVDYETNKEKFTKYNLDHDGDFECTGEYFPVSDIKKYELTADYSDYLDFDYYEFSEFLNTLIKNGHGYLLFSPKYGWQDRAVYKICQEKTEIFERSYDCDIYIKNASKGGKVLVFEECSHDNPVGCSWIAIALTKAEKRSIENKSFEDVQSFVEDHTKGLWC